MEDGFTYFQKAVAPEMVARLWAQQKEVLEGESYMPLVSATLCNACLLPYSKTNELVIHFFLQVDFGRRYPPYGCSICAYWYARYNAYRSQCSTDWQNSEYL